MFPPSWNYTHYSLNTYLTSWHTDIFRIIEVWIGVFRFSGLSKSMDRTSLSVVRIKVMNVNFKVPYLVVDFQMEKYVEWIQERILTYDCFSNIWRKFQSLLFMAFRDYLISLQRSSLVFCNWISIVYKMQAMSPCLPQGKHFNGPSCKAFWHLNDLKINRSNTIWMERLL